MPYTDRLNYVSRSLTTLDTVPLLKKLLAIEITETLQVYSGDYVGNIARYGSSDV